MLHPGADIVEQAGGIHQFSKRNAPMITDSGGFQVFSLAYGSVADEIKSKGAKKHGNSVLKISEEGVLFRSYRDGSPISLTPESSVIAQKKIGADIIIPLDELPPYHMGESALKKALARTHRWEKRSLDTHLKDPRQQAMYAVCHGGVRQDLRKESARFMDALPFDGFGIGGSLGKDLNELKQVLEYTTPYLDPNRPRHLLGIGDLPSIDATIQYGVDTYDSSYPTKAARHAVALTKNGPVRLRRTAYKADFSPIEEGCMCMTCQNYTKAWLHHLFKSHEVAAHTLTTIHNLAYMMRHMEFIRQAILKGSV
jgi:queuine tRNA-ribosyltransferase